MQKLLGVTELIGKAGSIPVANLAAKDYVMLYFSASWCGPCKTFTPKLVEFYNKNKEKKNFEIVFVSRDRDEPSFKAYYEHHPWPAMYGQEATALAQTMKVNGIPAVYIVDAKTGDVVNSNGRVGVMMDADATAFPWPPGLETTLLSKTVQSKDGPVNIADIKAKNDYILLYFSASWCGPCKMFTPKLVEFYEKHKESKKFEIIFLSLDRDQGSFDAYYEHHPWLAHYAPSVQAAAQIMGVSGIPSLFVTDAKTDEVLCKSAVQDVMADPEGAKFPWPLTLESLIGVPEVKSKSGTVKVADLIANKDYVLLYFSASWCGPCKAFTPKLVEFYNAHKESKKFEIVFLSLDRDQGSFDTYYEHHPWLAHFGDEVKEAAGKVGLEGIPTLAVVNAKTGKIITTEGVEKVMGDASAAEFPWN